MKAFFDEYGLVCIVVLVVVVLIGIVMFLKGPMQVNFEQIIQDFFTKSTTVANANEVVKTMIC